MATRIVLETDTRCKLYEPWMRTPVRCTYQQQSINVLRIKVWGENIIREYTVREYLSTTECRATRII
jgi:hypothetical protein